MKPPRVVLDTNVLVSGLCFGGPPAQILRLTLSGKIKIFTSPILIDEFQAVMNLKFPRREAAIADTLNELAFLWEVVSTEEHPPLSVIAEDPDDDRVIECAVAARAETIVSGDKRLLRLGRYCGIDILPPSRFLADRINL